MPDDLIDSAIDRAMLALTKASVAAKDAGDDVTMYGANRAWNEMFKVRQARLTRKVAA